MNTSSGKKSSSTQISSRASRLTGLLIQTDGTNAATATVYDTIPATATIQDITYTSVITTGGTNGNKVSIAYTDGAVAGSEVVSVSGNAISIQIESGVSTATQVKAAFDGSGAATALATATISGTAGTAQTAPVSATRLTGGAGDATILSQATVPGATRFAQLTLGEQEGINSNGGLYLALSGTGATAIVYYRA